MRQLKRCLTGGIETSFDDALTEALHLIPMFSATRQTVAAEASVFPSSSSYNSLIFESDRFLKKSLGTSFFRSFRYSSRVQTSPIFENSNSFRTSKSASSKSSLFKQESFSCSASGSKPSEVWTEAFSKIALRKDRSVSMTKV